MGLRKCWRVPVRACSLAYPARKEHAPYCIICDLPGTTTFFDIISQMTRFSKKVIEYKMFSFSLQLLSETFLILRRIQRDNVINWLRIGTGGELL